MKKLKSPPRDIDGFIARSPAAVRDALERVRAAIRKAAPEATETIKYGVPTFVLRENLVHFAAFKNHIGFYPTPSAISAFSRSVVGVQKRESSVQFPLASPMPVKLIEQMVRFRVKEVRGKDRS